MKTRGFVRGATDVASRSAGHFFSWRSRPFFAPRFLRTPSDLLVERIRVVLTALRLHEYSYESLAAAVQAFSSLINLNSTRCHAPALSEIRKARRHASRFPN